MPHWYKTVKARKQHKCIICKKPIEVGTTYLLHTFTEGFGMINHRMHEECDEAFDEYLDGLDARVAEAETELIQPQPRVIYEDQVYMDEDGEIKIME